MGRYPPICGPVLDSLFLIAELLGFLPYFFFKEKKSSRLDFIRRKQERFFPALFVFPGMDGRFYRIKAMRKKESISDGLINIIVVSWPGRVSSPCMSHGYQKVMLLYCAFSSLLLLLKMSCNVKVSL